MTHTHTHTDFFLNKQATLTMAICAATASASLPGFTFQLYDWNEGHIILVDGGYAIVGFLGTMISVIDLVSYIYNVFIVTPYDNKENMGIPSLA
jgi:hypothetical protein